MPPGGLIEELARVSGRTVSRETFDRLTAYIEALKAESAKQNLISASTLDNIWERHILDSAQLVQFEPAPGSTWLDIGAGAGLPGIVIACLVEGPVTLVEPRRLRADFLQNVVEQIGLNAKVISTKVEKVAGHFDVITARAVASLSRLLELSHHLSTRNTVWALPKGRSAHSELVDAQRAWQGTFHVKQSVTDAESYIVIGTGVRARS